MQQTCSAVLGGNNPNLTEHDGEGFSGFPLLLRRGLFTFLAAGLVDPIDGKPSRCGRTPLLLRSTSSPVAFGLRVRYRRHRPTIQSNQYGIISLLFGRERSLIIVAN